MTCPRGLGAVPCQSIFQGLAISLMAGEVASTVLSRMTVPVLYYLSQRNGNETAKQTGADLAHAE